MLLGSRATSCGVESWGSVDVVVGGFVLDVFVELVDVTLVTLVSVALA